MTPIKRRAIVRRFIPEMLQLGWTASKGLQFLRHPDIDLGIPRTDWLADWREFEGRGRKRDPLKAIRKDFYPTPETIEAAAYIQRKKFNYTYEVKGFDIMQKKDVTEWITVSSDFRLTMGEAEEEAERLTETYKREIEIDRLIISAVTTRVG